MKALWIVTLLAVSVSIQAQTAQAPAPQATGPSQQIAALKQAMQANQQKLAKYQWIQSTEVSVKGKVRKDSQAMCRYGVDGKVIKTPMGSPAQPQQAPQGGIRGRIIAKKTAEMKDEAADLKELVSHYAPPNPALLKAAKEDGNASATAANGIVTLNFANYYKQGDTVSIGFDTHAKKLVSYNVATFTTNSKTDVVTLTNTFASLPDGTNYLEKTVLDAKSKEIVVTITNAGYTPLGQ